MFISKANKYSMNWTINLSQSLLEERLTRKINYKYQTQKTIVGFRSKSQNQKQPWEDDIGAKPGRDQLRVLAGDQSECSKS